MAVIINFMTYQTFTFPSPAKLNLFLHITGRRTDGYHNLQTVFQFLDYGDEISFQKTDENTIELLTPIKGVAVEDNLIIKAAKALVSKSSKNSGVKISIQKRLPMGGGLGGGSSNAATTLVVLNKLWQCHCSVDELAKIGLSLGADVPIFVRGYAAFAEGIGEIITPCAPQEPWYLVTCPNVSISTQLIFNHPDLPRDTLPINIDNLDLSVNKNDCQNLVIKHYPEVAKLMAWLLEYAPSKMTGTGACLFSQFDSYEDAKQVQQLLPYNVQSFIAKGCNESPLMTAMKQWRD